MNLVKFLPSSLQDSVNELFISDHRYSFHGPMKNRMHPAPS